MGAISGSQTVATGSNDRLMRSVLHVCDAVGAFIEYWGFKAVHGRVWTLLALRKVPMAQSELAEVLGVSRSLISGTVADLVEQGLIAPVEDRRNAPYVANMDVWPVIKNVLRGREWMLLESTRLALEAAIEETEISLEEGQRPPFDLARMRLLLGMTELSQALLRLLFAIGVPHSSDGLDKWVHRAASLFSNFRKAR